MKGLARLLLAAGSVAAVWAPLGVIAVLGALTCWNILEFLLSPGLPVTLTFQAQSGKAIARVGGYSIDLDRKTVHFHDLSLDDSTGQRAVSVKRARLTLEGTRPTLWVNEANVILNRDSQGKIGLESLLPPPPSKESPLAFELKADSAHVTLADDLLDEVWRADITDLHLQHADGSSLASLRASINNEAPLPVSLHLSKKGDALIKTSFSEQEVAPFIPLLESFLPKEALYGWGGTRAASLKATGPLTVELNPREMAKLTGSFDVRADSLSIPGLIKSVDVAGKTDLAEDRARLELTASRMGTRLGFDGVGDFGGRLEGNVLLTSASKSSLWPELARLIPSGYDFSRASWQGRLSLGKDVALEGPLNAESITGLGYLASQPSADLAFNGSQLSVRLKRASLEGRKVEGWAAWNSKSGSLAGRLQSPASSFDGLFKRFKIKGADLEGPLDVVLSGTASKPLAVLSTRVQGWIDIGEGQEPLRLSRLDLRGAADRDGFRILRAAGLTPSGLASAAGRIGWNGSLDLSVEGAGLRLGSFVENVKGRAFVRASIKGTLDQPLVRGSAEAYSMEVFGRKVPYARSEFSRSGDSWSADKIIAQAGTGAVSGSLAWNQKTDALTGAFMGQSLLASDWLPDLLGSVDIREVRVGGQLKKPEAAISLASDSLVAYGFPLSDALAQAVWSGNQITLSSLTAKARSGEVFAKGALNFESKALEGSFRVNQAPLNMIPVSADVAVFGGEVTGEGLISGTYEVPKLDFTGDIKGAEINATEIGSGTVRAALNGQTLTLSGELGSLDRFIILNPSQIDFESRTLQAEADLLNIGVPDLVKATKDRWKSLEAHPQQIIRSLEGQVSGRATASGSLDDPVVALLEGQGANLKVLGRSAGSFAVAGKYEKGELSLQKGTWDTDSGIFQVSKGSWSTEKGLDLAGQITNLDLSWASLIDPGLPKLTGKVDSLAAVVFGPLDRLTGQASLSLGEVGIVGEKGTAKLIDSLNLDDVLLENGVVLANGRVRWQGLIAKLDASLPFSAFDEKAEKPARARASARLEPRPLSDFLEYAPGLKGATLDGTVEGTVEMGGQSGDWTLALDVRGKAAQIRLPKSPTWLKDVDLRVVGDSRQISLTAKADSSRQGSLQALIKAAYPDLLSRETDFTDLLESVRLDGSVTAESFRYEAPISLGAEDPAFTASSSSGATVSGQVTLKGTGSAPRIGGALRARNGLVNLPGKFPEGKSSRTPASEPVFEGLTLAIDDSAAINFGLGQIGVKGQGSLTGPLSALNLRMPLEVTSGTIKLPNARIRLEDGTVDVNMRGDAGSMMRIDVDLSGQTHVVARRGQDTYEDYSVDLRFRGDLLDSRGLNIDAQSDPGDLSREEILAILGQKQLIEALAGTALQGQGSASLRDPLYQLLTPTISDPITGPLARMLKLDYLSLDYNPLDQAIYRFGKSLGSGFFVQGWRQLSAPSFGPQKHDLRLSYRLPKLGPLTDRFRLSIGTTQDRPWRISIDWGRRF